jgi:Arm DNA-binding domain
VYLTASSLIRYNPASKVGKKVGKDTQMARQLHTLSARTVATLTKPGRHSDGGGLYLNITVSGARSWVFMWKADGKRREMGLGPLRDVLLAKARERERQRPARSSQMGWTPSQRETSPK